MMKFSSSRVVTASAASTTTVAAPAKVDLKLWKSLNVTKSNLVSSQGGETTRNVDGVVYSITYSNDNDEVVAVDRRRGLRFPTAIDEQNRIRVNTEAPVPVPVAGWSMDIYQPILKGTAPGAELVNGRAAMVGFLGIALVELASGQSALQQLSSPAGAAAAVALGAMTLAASVAPAVAGKVAGANVFPSDNDSYPDRTLPYVWNALAEKVNGRVAMVGTLGLLLVETFARQGAALL